MSVLKHVENNPYSKKRALFFSPRYRMCISIFNDTLSPQQKQLLEMLGHVANLFPKSKRAIWGSLLSLNGSHLERKAVTQTCLFLLKDLVPQALWLGWLFYPFSRKAARFSYLTTFMAELNPTLCSINTFLLKLLFMLLLNCDPLTSKLVFRLSQIEGAAQIWGLFTLGNLGNSEF